MVNQRINMVIPDSELVSKVKATGDESALCELVNRHSGIYYNTVKKYAPMNRVDDTYDDFYKRKHAEIFKAANSFNEDKGVKFSSWLANQTMYSCLAARQKQKLDPETIEYNEDFGEIDENTPETDFLKKEMISEILSFLKTRCRGRTYRVFEMKFFGNDGRGMNFKEISEKEGVSYQACQQLYQSAINLIKKEFA